MIQSKKDLKEYVLKDMYAHGRTKIKPRLFGDEVWKFQLSLRKHEYYTNTKSNIILKKYYSTKHRRLGIKLGFSIPCNTFGAGLRINHYGYIVVNENARIGEFCDIHQGVNIGQNIGNNVFIAPGAKLFGNITIADEIAIGANSVVNKSFNTPNVTIVGSPAKIIKTTGNIYKRIFKTI